MKKLRQNGLSDRLNDQSLRQEIKTKVHQRLVETLDLFQAQKLPEDELRQECLRRVDALLDEQRAPLTGESKRQLVREVMDEIFGLGPLEELRRDTSVSDILVNGPKQVFVERFGVLEPTATVFRNEEHLLQVIRRIASKVGRRIDEASPMLDARLEDGSRVNAIIPPLAIYGSVMSIRQFAVVAIESERLVELDSVSIQMQTFLEVAVRCKANILISGGTGTGKTTLLNVLSKWIPDRERVVTIEDAAELQLQREHVVALETRPPNTEGKGEVVQRDLLRNTLRMRPDRIILGEVRGGETLDMLQAMNTGHEGSMTTVHANSPRDALRRIENMANMAGFQYPIHVIRDQMAATLDLLVHVSRVTGGRRKLTSISEVYGMEGETVLTQELFRFRQDGVGEDGHAFGEFEACGVIPKFMDRLTAEGAVIPADLFKRKKVS